MVFDQSKQFGSVASLYQFEARSIAKNIEPRFQIGLNDTLARDSFTWKFDNTVNIGWGDH